MLHSLAVQEPSSILTFLNASSMDDLAAGTVAIALLDSSIDSLMALSISSRSS
jgi:hypothetical protein